MSQLSARLVVFFNPKVTLSCPEGMGEGIASSPPIFRGFKVATSAALLQGEREKHQARNPQPLRGQDLQIKEKKR
jgi:hypothetical protein